MKISNCNVYLVNTGWNGTNKRISIKATRCIIDSILNGSILKAPTEKIPVLDLLIPKSIPGIESEILDPRSTHKTNEEWVKKARKLATMFDENYKKLTYKN